MRNERIREGLASLRRRGVYRRFVKAVFGFCFCRRCSFSSTITGASGARLAGVSAFLLSKTSKTSALTRSQDVTSKLGHSSSEYCFGYCAVGRRRPWRGLGRPRLGRLYGRRRNGRRRLSEGFASRSGRIRGTPTSLMTLDKNNSNSYRSIDCCTSETSDKAMGGLRPEPTRSD